MRHLLSLVLSIVVTPLIYVTAGISAVKLGETQGLGAPAAIGLVAAFVAGGLYALLVMARLSPFGPVLAGLLYFGVTLWALLDFANFSSTIPADLAGFKDALHVQAPFGTALLAVPLLFTVFSPRRWRKDGDPAAVTGYEAAPLYPPTPGSAAPSYDPPSLATTFEPPVYTPSAAPSYDPVTPAAPISPGAPPTP